MLSKHFCQEMVWFLCGWNFSLRQPPRVLDYFKEDSQHLWPSPAQIFQHKSGFKTYPDLLASVVNKSLQKRSWFGIINLVPV